MAYLLTILATLVLAACGGGGTEDDKAVNPDTGGACISNCQPCDEVCKGTQ